MNCSNQQTSLIEEAQAGLRGGRAENPFLTLSRRLSASGAVNHLDHDVQSKPQQTAPVDSLVAVVMKSAEAHYIAGNLATAREFLALLNHGNRHTAESAQSLGNLHILLGAHQEAAECYHASLTLNPKSIDAWVGLSVACQHLGDDVNAETCIREALNLEPANHPALRLHADRKLKAKSFQEAALTYRKLIGSYPDQEGVFLSLAKCFFELGDRESCEAALRYVLEIAPNNALARENLAALSTPAES